MSQTIEEHINSDAELEYSTHGIMFDVMAKNPLKITGIKIRPGTGKESAFSLYYRKGPWKGYHANSNEWTNAGTTPPKACKCCVLVKLDVPLDVTLKAGETCALYVHSPSHPSSIGYVHKGTGLGHVFHSGQHLDVSEGTFTRAPEPFTDIDGYPRQFSGVIEYELVAVEGLDKGLTELQYETVHSGLYGKHPPEYKNAVLLQTKEEAKSAELKPEIIDTTNFDTHFLAYVASGEKPTGGFTITTKRIAYSDGRFVIDAEDIEPKQGKYSTMAITHPFCVLRIAKPTTVPFHCAKLQEVEIKWSGSGATNWPSFSKQSSN